MADKVTIFKKDAPRWASQAREENMSQLADEVAKRVLAERERRLRKSNLTASPSETPRRANVGSASGGSGGSSSSKRTRSEIGRRKIEAIARSLMKKDPRRFKSLAQAVAHVTRENIEGAAEVFKNYCTGSSARLTEAEHIEKSKTMSATEQIVRGIEAVPHGTHTEKLAKVLTLWPDLAREWHQGR